MTEQKQDQVLGHDYDGIQEYDNRLPNWWLYTLYGAVVFGIFYWLYFQTSGAGALPVERYEREMVKAAEAQLERLAGQELTNDTFEVMTTVPARVESGQQIFSQFCVVCHQADGSGNVGPNLTDAYWIHGGQGMDIYTTVMEGVPEKGMAAWSGQLGPMRVMDVTAYVLTLKGKNLPGKEPQGELESDAPGAAEPEDGATPPADDATPNDTGEPGGDGAQG